LAQTLNFSKVWFIAKQTPYIGGNYYPPLATVLFTPLTAIKYTWAYRIILLANVFCYVMISFVFPLQIDKEKRVSSLLLLVFITGLFSYGFQFELERGQFNVIAIFMCFLAIWIFHYHNKYRYLAYIFFTISVQLKVYPLIFIIMLISNWQDWKNNIKRFFVLAAVNFGLLFVLGRSVFDDFIKEIIAHSVKPYIWPGNHSIKSFVTLLSETAFDNGWVWVKQYLGLAQIALLAIVVVCLFLIILQTYLQKQKGLNPLLLLACTIGALLIPAVSNDYKLSILAAPVAVLLLNNKFWERANSPFPHEIFILPLLIFSAAYFSTLFSYTNKPGILDNNLPALFTMLLVITFLSLVNKNKFE
jgi:hypothetical protein